MRAAPITGVITVTELPLQLEAVSPDPFVATLPGAPAPAPGVRRRLRPRA